MKGIATLHTAALARSALFALLAMAALAVVSPAFSSAASAETAPDYVREAQTCSRVDLRPALEKAGFEAIRNRGGREDNVSFALSEMLGLELGQAISARWLEHWIEDHDAQDFRKLQTATRAILAARLRPCLEDAVKSEDIESTRLARLRLLSRASADLNPSFLPLFELFGTPAYARASMTSFACKDSERTNEKPRASLTLTESHNAEMIDRSLRAGRLPLVMIEANSETARNETLNALVKSATTFAIAGRRLSASSGRCEYLVRTYEGPTCPGTQCEDGSQWIERETLAPALQKIWSLEP